MNLFFSPVTQSIDIRETVRQCEEHSWVQDFPDWMVDQFMDLLWRLRDFVPSFMVNNTPFYRSECTNAFDPDACGYVVDDWFLCKFSILM